MANVTINDLTAAGSVTDTQQFEVDITGTSSRKVTGSQIKAYVKSGLVTTDITGLTATSAELNVLDGILPTTTELNFVDGVTSSIQTQINGKANSTHTHVIGDITGVTASVTELNYSSGVTSSIQTQINGKAASSHTHTLSNISDVSATSTEVNYSSGVTSSIQTQLNGKASSSHTHTLSNVSDVSATSTEVNYLSGVTSSVQTQLNGKASSSHTHTLSSVTDVTSTASELNVLDGITSTTAELNILDGVTASASDLNVLTGAGDGDGVVQLGRTVLELTSTTLTLGTTHQNKFLYMTNSSTSTITIPPNSTTAFPIGTEIEVWRGLSSVAITEGSGVTLAGNDGTNSITTTATIPTVNTGVCIKKVETDKWVCFGNFTSS